MTTTKKKNLTFFFLFFLFPNPNSDAVFATVLLRTGAQVLLTNSAGQNQSQWRTAAAAAFLSGAALPALSWLPSRSGASPSSSDSSSTFAPAPFSRARASSADIIVNGGGFEGADAVRAAASAVVALLCPLLSAGDALALFSSGRRGEVQQHRQQQQRQQQQEKQPNSSPFVVAVTSNLSHRGSGSGGSGGGSSSSSSAARPVFLDDLCCQETNQILNQSIIIYKIILTISSTS